MDCDCDWKGGFRRHDLCTECASTPFSFLTLEFRFEDVLRSKVVRLKLSLLGAKQGHHVFESRATIVDSWDACYVTNGLFVDDPGNLPLNPSYAAFTDSFGDFEEMGGAMLAGILLPWNEDEDGGMVISNCTFVNFVNPCIRGCAHCGRGGSPVLGDGAFETRFSGMTFVNSNERALFRHPNEAFLYDMDGSLTGSGIRETYTEGGSVVGSSFVGNSILLPNDGACTVTAMSTHGTGGAVCHGHIFRRMWYHIREPDAWVGKALCVRLPHQSSIDTCQSLQVRASCCCVWNANLGPLFDTWIFCLSRSATVFHTLRRRGRGMYGSPRSASDTTFRCECLAVVGMMFVEIRFLAHIS